jgi:hypothetical protein
MAFSCADMVAIDLAEVYHCTLNFIFIYMCTVCRFHGRGSRRKKKTDEDEKSFDRKNHYRALFKSSFSIRVSASCLYMVWSVLVAVIIPTWVEAA